jgi:hypothetical protein
MGGGRPFIGGCGVKKGEQPWEKRSASGGERRERWWRGARGNKTSAPSASGLTVLSSSLARRH